MPEWISRESKDFSIIAASKEEAIRTKKQDLTKAPFREAIVISVVGTEDREQLIKLLENVGINVNYDEDSGTIEIYTGKEV